MSWYDLAATCFVALIILKFVVGMFSERFDLSFEFDAFHDVLFCVFFCGAWATAAGDVTSWMLAASVAFFASTLWSAISVFKNSTLLQIYRSRGR
jgi:hypothetical protein